MEDPLLLVKESDCGGLTSFNVESSAPKSSSGVEGWIALIPNPEMGTAKVGLLSGLVVVGQFAPLHETVRATVAAGSETG